METEITPARCGNCGADIAMLSADHLDAIRHAAVSKLPGAGKIAAVQLVIERKDGSTVDAWAVPDNQPCFTCPGCGVVGLFRPEGDLGAN